MISFIRRLFGRLVPNNNHTMTEKKLDLQELDQILTKNTSELPNHLQGVSFSVFTKNGGYCTVFLTGLIFPACWISV